MSQLPQSAKPDSSYSKTYLTRANHRYVPIHKPTTDPQLLAERRARNEHLKAQRARPSKTRDQTVATGTAFIASTFPKDKGHVSEEDPSTSSTSVTMAIPYEDVNRPPESSDDEENVPQTSELNAELPMLKNTKSSYSKRLALENTDANRRSKRLKGDLTSTVASGEQEPSLPSSEYPSSSMDFDFNFSQSSQSQRRKNNTYSKKLLHIPQFTPETPKKDSKFSSFNTYTTPLERTPPSRSHGKKNLNNLIESPLASIPPALLQVPDLLGLSDNENTNSTTGALKGTTFDKPARKPRRRSSVSSTSSLSSSDSIASVQLDERTKARLRHDEGHIADSHVLLHSDEDEVPSTHIRCPICRRITPKAGLDLGSRKSSALSIRDQHRLCYTHRVCDAKSTWAERNYPIIDFESLSTSPSLQRHLKLLVDVINRRKDSFYLQKLDEAIAVAKGNQTKIAHFFSTQSVDFVHFGYYGPKGARTISRTIAECETVRKSLKKQVRADKAFRIAGLGRSIETILLPEMLTQLIQDDMGLVGQGSREKARQVLEESVEIGLILCGDDDNLEVDDSE